MIGVLFSVFKVQYQVNALLRKLVRMVIALTLLPSEHLHAGFQVKSHTLNCQKTTYSYIPELSYTN